MPATLTPTDAQAILARETTRHFLDCLTISGDGLPTRLLVENTEELVRAAGTFQPAAFKATGPDDSDTLNPGMTVTLDNVDRDAVRLLKTYAGIPACTFETVTAETPDALVHGPFEFVIKDARADRLVIELSLGYEEEFLNQQVPKDSYSPTNSPGMYP